MLFTQGSDTLLAPSASVLSVGISSCNRWLSALYCFYWNFPGWAIPVLNIKCWFAHRRHGDLVSSISYISQYKYVIYKGKKNRDLGFKTKRCLNYDFSGILFPRSIFSSSSQDGKKKNSRLLVLHFLNMYLFLIQGIYTCIIQFMLQSAKFTCQKKIQCVLGRWIF